jgi:formamidopyrimidine-DNA glycosylase
VPELPEVESVRRGLSAHLPSSRILSAQNLHRRLLSAHSIASLDLLNGLVVQSISRRGKFLWIEFKDEDLLLVAHLGMSGQFRVFDDTDGEFHPHTRARFILERRRKRFRLDFLDQRTFGWLRVDERDDGGFPSSISHIAPDPFEESFDIKSVIERISTRKSEIKRAILDQSTISGVGNIYADESLWRARIHPERNARSLSQEELRLLITSIRVVMKRAMNAGGTTFDQLYVNVNGESGYFANKLAVYGREGERCRRCGGIIKRIQFTNRSSHYCPRCQRIR